MSIVAGRLPTTKEFAALDRPAQLDVLRRAGARQKARLLLDTAAGAELFALLPPQDVYLMARELGPDQVPELLGMATAEQWTAFFDFDCWDGDRFESGQARAWLAVLLDGEEPRIAETLLGLDFELLVLMLHHEVLVLSGPEDIAEEAQRGEVVRRDGGYVLDYRDEAGAKLYGALLDILFRHAPEFFRYLLEAIRAEAESLLEESVFQQRAARLLDQGFPEPHAAQAVYAWLDPEHFTPGEEGKIPLGGSPAGSLPGAILQQAPAGGLLGAALSDGVDEQTAWELACLVNKVLMAERVDLGELGQVRDAVEQAYLTLNLALEFLAGDEVEQARRTLHDAYAEQLFRLGFSLTLRLQRRARALHSSSIAPYLGREERAGLEALLLRRPRLYQGLTRPGHGGLRPFANLRELRLAEALLDRLEVQRRLFEERMPFPLPTPQEWELAGCHPRSGSQLTLDAIFLTALANRLLDRPFAPQPLAARELAVLHGLISSAGKLDPELRRQTESWLEALEPGAGSFASHCLDLWEEEFCTARSTDLDPRYVGGMIVRIG